MIPWQGSGRTACDGGDIYVKPDVPDAWCADCGHCWDPCPNGQNEEVCSTCAVGEGDGCVCEGTECIYLEIPMRV